MQNLIVNMNGMKVVKNGLKIMEENNGNYLK